MEGGGGADILTSGTGLIETVTSPCIDGMYIKLGGLDTGALDSDSEGKNSPSRLKRKRISQDS